MTLKEYLTGCHYSPYNYKKYEDSLDTYIDLYTTVMLDRRLTSYEWSGIMALLLTSTKITKKSILMILSFRLVNAFKRANKYNCIESSMVLSDDKSLLVGVSDVLYKVVILSGKHRFDRVNTCKIYNIDDNLAILELSNDITILFNAEGISFIHGIVEIHCEKLKFTNALKRKLLYDMNKGGTDEERTL